MLNWSETTKYRRVHFGTTALCYPDIADKYESWQRLLRITAWILKWSHSRGFGKKGQLSAEEIKDAELCWLKIIQKTSFRKRIWNLSKGKVIVSASPILKLDPVFDQEKQLIRVGGRFRICRYTIRCQTPNHHPQEDQTDRKTNFTFTYKRFPFWTRNYFGNPSSTFLDHWGTTWGKEILKKCLICQHWKTKPCQQKMAPLPAERVQMVPAFTNIGLDFMGPLYLKAKEKEKSSQATKHMYVLFVCEDTRAVHLNWQIIWQRKGIPTSISSDGKSTRYVKYNSFGQSDIIS